jgi:FKBP-type peptidyl-prolyl cis-trans isomerase SlyD
MNVALNKIVTVEYELTDEGGTVLDSSRGHGPLVYLHGAGTILPALEQALEDHAPGDSIQATLAPPDAYGEREEGLLQTMPRERFAADMPIEVGMQFQGQLDDDDEERVFTVIDADQTSVTIDGNHPLAGVTLKFDVQVIDVRDATPEELDHGHPHGPGGAHDHAHGDHAHEHGPGCHH